MHATLNDKWVIIFYNRHLKTGIPPDLPLSPLSLGPCFISSYPPFSSTVWSPRWLFARGLQTSTGFFLNNLYVCTDLSAWPSILLLLSTQFLKEQPIQLPTLPTPHSLLKWSAASSFTSSQTCLLEGHSVPHTPWCHLLPPRPLQQEALLQLSLVRFENLSSLGHRHPGVSEFVYYCILLLQLFFGPLLLSRPLLSLAWYRGLRVSKIHPGGSIGNQLWITNPPKKRSWNPTGRQGKKSENKGRSWQMRLLWEVTSFWL